MSGVAVSAAEVKKLREVSGMGMMECKKALVECGGDFERARDWLRVKSGAKASRVADRAAGEGCIAFGGGGVGAGVGALVLVSCETDFVARDENLINFASDVAARAVDAATRGAGAATRGADVTATDSSAGDSQATADDSQAAGADAAAGDASVGDDSRAVDAAAADVIEDEAVESARRQLIMKVGENINVKRVVLLRAAEGERLGHYIHAGNKVAAMCVVRGGGESLARDLCMHIAAMRPLYLDVADVPAEVSAREREIFTQQSVESGKAEDIARQMAEGKLKKRLAEITLLNQAYVREPKQTVRQIAESQNATITTFTLITV